MFSRTYTYQMRRCALSRNFGSGSLLVMLSGSIVRSPVTPGMARTALPREPPMRARHRPGWRGHGLLPYPYLRTRAKDVVAMFAQTPTPVFHAISIA